MLFSFVFCNFYSTAVVATFESVSNDVWETYTTAGVSSSVMYAVGVIHGILKARQMYGSVGLSQFYALSTSVYCQALDTLMTSSGGGEQLSNDAICDLLINVIIWHYRLQIIFTSPKYYLLPLNYYFLIQL